MITEEQFRFLDDLFKYYNSKLFDSKLKDCIIITNRKKDVPGHFSSLSWKVKGRKKFNIHEISLNPDFFNNPAEEWHAVLVREMVCMWQKIFGELSPNSRYYNKQWAQKMEEIGLMPSSTGKPGGEKTGREIKHYIVPDGLFMKAFNGLAEKQIKYVPALTIQKDKKTTSKTKYTCPCNNKVWGKPNLIIICGVCNKKYEEVVKETKKTVMA